MLVSLLGTVIATGNGPTPTSFSFVVTRAGLKNFVKRSQFVQVPSAEGTVIAVVENIVKTNKYFQSAEHVKEYSRLEFTLDSIFPTTEWEYLIVDCKSLGVFDDERLFRPSYPVSPGNPVYNAEEDLLKKFLGLDEKGIFIGTLTNYDVEVKLNMTRLFQKHVAILAISGAGKSYLSTVLLEELLTRSPAEGRVTTVVFDVHGEYSHLALKESSGNLSENISVYPAENIKFNTAAISPAEFARFLPNMSPVQQRELAKALSKLRKKMIKKKSSYGISDIIKQVEHEEMNQKTKDALVGWLYKLKNTRLFDYMETPDIESTFLPGRTIIFDLSTFTSIYSKQLILTYFASRIFELRKRSSIPPTVMFVEEAHQFCPEQKQSMAISKGIIETIAREGRKFYTSLVLISQRPVNLSTTALSQCNTHMIMRILNPYDLDYIGRTSEGITRETLDAITTLNVGEVLIAGNAINYPTFVKVRKRKTKEIGIGESLEEVAKKYEFINNK